MFMTTIQTNNKKDDEHPLAAKCHVNENGDGDRFVGIKADSNNAMVYFPMGYKVPDDEDSIREDILQLIAVMAEFTEKKDRVLHMPKFATPQSVDFPVNAYISIIRGFLDTKSYYKEKESTRKYSDHGRIDWAASLRKGTSLYQEDGSPFFNKFVTRGSTPNDKNLITSIHRYCVYEAFTKLGWLFTPHLPEDPHIPLEKERFLHKLKQKLAATHNDKDKLLFKSMKAMIEFLDDPTTDRQFYFGTDRFEYVWERLIDEAFGEKDKEKYFPHTSWTLRYAAKNKKGNAALEPDSIMLYKDKIYVLDAKYYRYGVTAQPAHLPESTSINKQITYAEYIYNNAQIKAKYGDDVPVFNAFIMPYNKENNSFNSADYFLNIGEAVSDWKFNDHKYERVQGILVDIRFLMHNYFGDHTSKKRRMAETIDQAITDNASIT